ALRGVIEFGASATLYRSARGAHAAVADRASGCRSKMFTIIGLGGHQPVGPDTLICTRGTRIGNARARIFLVQRRNRRRAGGVYVCSVRGRGHARCRTDGSPRAKPSDNSRASTPASATTRSLDATRVWWRNDRLPESSGTSPDKTASGTRPWSFASTALRVDRLAARQHREELGQVPRTRFRPLCRRKAVEDRVAVLAGQKRDRRLRPGLGGGGWGESCGSLVRRQPGMGGPPASARPPLPAPALPRRLHPPLRDQSLRQVNVPLRPSAPRPPGREA